MNMKKPLLKIVTIIVIAIGLFKYIEIQKNKFVENKIKTTQRIIENLDIREENFFENEKYVKENKVVLKAKAEKAKEVEIRTKVKKIMQSKRYVLQIATYGVKENAIRMQERLKVIDNFLIENSNINKKYYVVVSREFYSRNEAEALEMKVNEKFSDLKPLIKLRYDNGESSKY